MSATVFHYINEVLSVEWWKNHETICTLTAGGFNIKVSEPKTGKCPVYASPFVILLKIIYFLNYRNTESVSTRVGAVGSNIAGCCVVSLPVGYTVT